MRAAYDSIYFEIKGLIEDGTYPFMSLLPSESMFVRKYGCAHNTIRKALSALAADGYVLPIHGKGVRVIYRPFPKPNSNFYRYTANDLSSFRDLSVLNGFTPSTSILNVHHVVVDSQMSAVTRFDEGVELLHIERVRLCNKKALSRESNYFRTDIVEGITNDDINTSVYAYIESRGENQLVTCKRFVEIQQADERDYELLQMDGADSIVVVRQVTYDSLGTQCEFSEIRHHPYSFSLEQVIVRSRIHH